MPTTSLTAPNVERVRNFNRFYTRRIGVLHEGLLDSAFTLAESRVLWELTHRTQPTATELARALDLDAGYLSRLLRGLKARDLIHSTSSPDDARQLHLSLTTAGKRAFAPLDRRSQANVSTLLATLTDEQQTQLLQAMNTLERLLGEPSGKSSPARSRAPCILRPHRAGDLGWVIGRHGALYGSEYRLDASFEAMVARIAADFLDRFDPAREAGWIAERDGARLGCVFLVQARDDATQAVREGVGQLRMLLVEPAARGLGLGAQLVAECERFARQANYRHIVLWTQSNLVVARAIYKRAGYRLTASEPQTSFGQTLVAERWEMAL